MLGMMGSSDGERKRRTIERYVAQIAGSDLRTEFAVAQRGGGSVDDCEEGRRGESNEGKGELHLEYLRPAVGDDDLGENGGRDRL